MGDIHRRRAQALLEAGQLRAGLYAQLGIQVGQRLIHKKGLRLADNGPAHGHALALAAGQILGLALEILGQAERFRRLVHLGFDLGFGKLRQLQGKAHVFLHRQVWVEGIVLEDHGDIAIAWFQVGHVLAVDGDAAAGGRFQARQRA